MLSLFCLLNPSLEQTYSNCVSFAPHFIIPFCLPGGKPAKTGKSSSPVCTDLNFIFQLRHKGDSHRLNMPTVSRYLHELFMTKIRKKCLKILKYPNRTIIYHMIHILSSYFLILYLSLGVGYGGRGGVIGRFGAGQGGPGAGQVPSGFGTGGFGPGT